MGLHEALHRSEAGYCGGQKIFINQISQLWTQFKAAHPEHSVPSSIDGHALRHLDSAFQHFFRRVKLGQKPGYSAPKGASSPVRCSLSIDPRHQSKAEAWNRGELQLPGFGLCRFEACAPTAASPRRFLCRVTPQGATGSASTTSVHRQRRLHLPAACTAKWE